jgi:hypothetical protein
LTLPIARHYHISQPLPIDVIFPPWRAAVPNPHPPKAKQCIHPKKFKTGVTQAMFIYGEKMNSRPKVRSVRLSSTYHPWSWTIEEIKNEYIDLTVKPLRVRGKPKRRRGNYSYDDVTVTITLEDSTTDSATLCDVEFDDSRWLADQKKPKKTSAAEQAKKTVAAKKAPKKAK